GKTPQFGRLALNSPGGAGGLSRAFQAGSSIAAKAAWTAARGIGRRGAGVSLGAKASRSADRAGTRAASRVQAGRRTLRIRAAGPAGGGGASREGPMPMMIGLVLISQTCISPSRSE